MASIQLSLQSDFGYVVLVIILSYVVINWMALQVMKARKRYEVKYPDMYSATEPMFNCIQRAHQNTIENYPFFLVTLLLGGLMYPRVCALSGLLYQTSRIVYARGYYTGSPENRNRGAFGYVGLLVNLGSTVALALHLLGWL